MENGSSIQVPDNALAAKKKITASFFRKGIILAILSGMCYGCYSAFLYWATGRGVWVNWYALAASTSSLLMLGALGSAINDTISGIWCIIIAAFKGKLGDFFRVLNTKPGHIMMLCALFGGPIASTAYVVAFKMAGSMVIPITALCPAIGAILGRLFFKQKLNLRMIIGIIICVIASCTIGLSAAGADGNAKFAGCLIALIAAFGWGFEGCVAGYGTSLIDYEIGITIRQCTSGLTNLIILVPLIGIISGNAGSSFTHIVQAVTSGPAMIIFVISGFFAVFAYSLWYKGNSMCGAALGMTCNGMYSFWGPFFTWIIVGLLVGWPNMGLAPISWVAAIVMAIGIFLIAMNPMDLFKKKEAL